MAKNYTIISKRVSFRGDRKNRTTEITGDLKALIDYFSYILEIGASYNRSINKNPKTIKSFLTNLKKSLDEKEGATYTRTFVSLKETTNSEPGSIIIPEESNEVSV